MFKKFRDKIALSGILVLGIGVALLVFTFISAYGFLGSATNPSDTGGLEQIFGSALAPLIGTAIRIMYLGVMGWIGSLLTIRGVTIVTHTPQMPTVAPQKSIPVPVPEKPLPLSKKPKAEKPQEETKPEAKPSEQEFVVKPSEQVSQLQPEPKKLQKNDPSL